MKRFLLKFLLTFTTLYICVAVYKYLIYPDVTGDLSALRKIPVGSTYANNILSQFPFDASYIQLWFEGMRIDSGSVIVIGDSFSNKEEPNQQGNQKENSWSRYTAEELGIQIINFRNYHCGFVPEHLFLCLVERKIIPDYSIVIIESVERHLIARLTAHTDENYYQTYVDGLRMARTSRNEETIKKKIDWVKETTIFMRYLMGKDCPTHKFKLSKPCFSHQRYGSTLFSYFEDEKNINDNVSTKIHTMRNTLDTLFYVARQHNITLYYMIAADKYDAYESLIVK